jgi:surfeit locus 1 family protein
MFCGDNRLSNFTVPSRSADCPPGGSLVSPVRRATLVVTVLAVAAVAVALGRWQLRRLHARRASNAILLSARRKAPLHLPDDLRRGVSIDSGRRVEARGHFDMTDEVVIRGRVQDDAPGVQIVTPFILDSGAGVLWVMRGFARSPDAVTPPASLPRPVVGQTVVSGMALAAPSTTDSGQPLLHNGTMTWKRLDRAMLTRRRPGSLPVYLLLAGDSGGPGRLAVVAPPELNDGPHLSYAIQWFGIALAVLTFGAIMLWRGGRARPQPRAAP